MILFFFYFSVFMIKAWVLYKKYSLWTRNWNSETASEFPNSIYLVSGASRIPVQFCLTQIIFYLSSKHSTFTRNQEAKLPCPNTCSPLHRAAFYTKHLMAFICLLICLCIYLYSFNSRKIKKWIPTINTL